MAVNQILSYQHNYTFFSGPRVEMDASQPSGGRRSLMKIVSLGSITAGRSFMKMTACCLEKGTVCGSVC